MAYGMPPPGGFGTPPGPPQYAPGWGPPQQQHQAPMPPQGPFPPRLEDAPRDRRIDETFGWFPGSVAVAGVLGILGAIVDAIVEGGFDDMKQIQAVGIAALAVVLFGFWEIWRRLHPTSLIVMPDAIGLYRKGSLDAVVRPGQLTWFRLNIANSIREYFLFGICGLAGLLGAPSALMSGHLGGALWSASVGIGGTLAFVSAIWSRGMCRHYYVPKGGGTETVVLRKTELQRLGCWPFPL